MTLQLVHSLHAWGTPDFNAALKQEVERLDHDRLPLQKGLSIGNHVLDVPVSAMVIATSETAAGIRAKVGIFYTSILTGCACTNDPTPESENNEYCVVQFDIDRATGAACVRLVDA